MLMQRFAPTVALHSNKMDTNRDNNNILSMFITLFVENQVNIVAISRLDPSSR